MSGILDSKTRVIDSVITQEGKRQISTGGLRAVYATVSDKHSYYEYHAVSGSADATKRVYFEPPIENNNDSIVMEADDSGHLMGYPGTNETLIARDGTVYVKETVESSIRYSPAATEANFASAADRILDSAVERFTNLQTIGTRDPDESLSLRMEINPKSHTFTMNNTFPFTEGFESARTNVDYAEPLFFDEMLANSPNFKYLPPVTDDLSSEEQEMLSSGRLQSGAAAFLDSRRSLLALISDPNSEVLRQLAVEEGETVSKIRNLIRKLFGSYTKFQRPHPMSLQEIMSHLNQFPELRRLQDHSTPPEATSGLAVGRPSSMGRVISGGEVTEKVRETLELLGGGGTPSPGDDEATTITDPDADDDTGIFEVEKVTYSAGGVVTGGLKRGITLSRDHTPTYTGLRAVVKEQVPRERVSVAFNPTSSTNNIIMQIFEYNSQASKLLKLDVIHYDEFNSSNMPNFQILGQDLSHDGRPTKNVFFAGKIFHNSIGLPVFINIFTIIMD